MQRVAKHESIEVRYSWVICGAVAYISALYSAWTVSGAILTNELEVIYGHNNPTIVTQASFSTAFCFAIYCFATLFGAVVMRYVGLRPVGFVAAVLVSYGLCISPHNPSVMWWVLTYGVQAGIGFGFMAICTATIQSHYFDRNHGLNYGIAQFCSGLMTVGYPLLWTGFLDSIGFANAMYVFSGMFFTSLVPVALLKPRSLPTEQSRTEQQAAETTGRLNSIDNMETASINASDHQELIIPDNESLIVVYQQPNAATTDTQNAGQEEQTQAQAIGEKAKQLLRVQLFRNKSFIIFIFGTSMRLFGTGTFTLNIVSFSRLFYPDSPYKTLLSVMGVTQCFARLVAAWLVDRLPLTVSYYIEQATQVLAALAIIGVTFSITSGSFALTMLSMAFYGIWDGASFAMQYPLLCRILQRDSIPMGVSFHLILLGVLASIGPAVSGLIVDLTKSYTLAMISSTIPVMLGAIIMFFANLQRDVKMT